MPERRKISVDFLDLVWYVLVLRLIEGTELDQLRTWTNNDLLYRYILIGDSGKEPPYNKEIKEMYEYIITEGDYPGYS